MNIGEEYRWNIKTITYGFDESFLNYFGQEGVNAINKAFAILNGVPAYSSMSSNLNEYPVDTRRMNYRASALGLLDLKSAALGILVNQIGLNSPDRFVWTLRARNVINNVPYYSVIKRNFDPVTFQPSSYVNGVLYTYAVVDFFDHVPEFWDAVEIQVDPLAFGATAVASDWGSFPDTALTPGSGALSPALGIGEFYMGLTRDDVGGLRYLYRPSNYNVENLTGNLTLSSSNPFMPAGGGAGDSNSVPVGIAPRSGVDHLTFVQGQYDSLIGNFITMTNSFTDTYVTNGSLTTQTLQRIVTSPDILFTAGDLGVGGAGGVQPVLVGLTVADAPEWINNDGINGAAGTLDGPGVIVGPMVMTFSKIGPYVINSGPTGGSFLDEFNSLFSGFVWGSYDATTNEPIVYPLGTSITDLEQQVLSGQ